MAASPRMLSASDVVNQRKSVRAFRPDPVDPSVLQRCLATAARAASGGNLQPWRLHVLQGDSLAALKARMTPTIIDNPHGERPLQYDIYPPRLPSPYRDHRYKVGEDLYALLGVGRDNKLGRLAWLTQNFQFFGAPVGVFCLIDAGMGRPQWSDLGMYLQTLMLLLTEAGLASCAQEAWSLYHRTVREYLGLDDRWVLFCGMAIGHADPDAPQNRLETSRAPLSDFCTFHD